MSALEIVQAVPDDAQAIGELRAHNWEEQYANLPGVTAEWMGAEIERIAGTDGVQSRAQWIERACQPNVPNYWLVARLAGDRALAGFLEARKHDNATQELRSLHVASGARSLGIGQALMDVANREWLEPAVDTFLDVAKTNESGQRFYQRPRNGYTFTGHEFLYGPIAMLQMVRKAQC